MSERDQFLHWCEQHVRWGDMDAYGHVNNTTYFTYCESARMFYFDQLRLDDYREAPAHGPAVVSATCDFRSMLHYPAELEVGVRTSAIGRKSFTLEYLIVRADSGEIVADGSSVVVWVDYATSSAIEVPVALKTKIREVEKPELG